MGGFFGTISASDCVNDLFYGTDYNSHLGTKKGGIAVKNSKEFKRSIHNLENSYFRTKFEPDLSQFHGNSGIGISIGVTTLKYQKLDDLVKAIGLPKEKICTHCWDGSSYF